MSTINNSIKYEGELDLNGLKIPCYVLEDGRRVLSTTGMQKALKITSEDSSDRSATRLAQILSAKNLNRCFPSINIAATYKSFPCFLGNKKISAYDAIILPELCETMLKVRDCAIANNEELGSRQKNMITQCDIIIRALAKVGIIALVDEATGYQKDKNRAKDELQKFLNQFLTEEASRWVKTFNDSFFEMIYKMRGWNWNDTHKRPAVVGQWINDIVYKRLAPGVLEELKIRNPKNDKGHKTKQNHRFLSEEIGRPKLKEHLAAIEALGKAADYNWDKFKELLNKVFPIQDELYDKIMMGADGDSFNKEKMGEIAKQIFDYNPKNDPKDPLYKKDKGEDNEN